MPQISKKREAGEREIERERKRKRKKHTREKGGEERAREREKREREREREIYPSTDLVNNSHINLQDVGDADGCCGRGWERQAEVVNHDLQNPWLLGHHLENIRRSSICLCTPPHQC